MHNKIWYIASFSIKQDLKILGLFAFHLISFPFDIFFNIFSHLFWCLCVNSFMMNFSSYRHHHSSPSSLLPTSLQMMLSTATPTQDEESQDKQIVRQFNEIVSCFVHVFLFDFWLFYFIFSSSQCITIRKSPSRRVSWNNWQSSHWHPTLQC